MSLRFLPLSLWIATLPLAAQDSGVAPTAPPLPAAGSPEAAKMIRQAVDKMVAFGRGRFSTSIERDNAMFRQAGLPIGGEEEVVEGGWQRDLVWGEVDGRRFRIGNGRMLAESEGEWRLRRDKLDDGVPLPFVADPDYLFTVLQQLPDTTWTVANVEAGKIRGRDVAVLTMQIEGESALELADSGAIPGGGGGFRGVMMFGGIGGGMAAPPRPQLTTWLAFHVDVQNGDLLRFGARTFEKDAMFGKIRVAIQNGAGGADEEEEVVEEETAEAADAQAPAGRPQWRQGFPVREPNKDESVATFQLDFSDLGVVKAPELDDRARRLLRLR